MEVVADQHNLRQYVKIYHKVVGAKWSEAKQKWSVTVTRTDGRRVMVSSRDANKEGEVDEPFTEECDIFINATGCFNDWKWPSIPGRKLFRGQMLHSAVWPEKDELNLKGKTIGLVGNGSTGVQILPAILDEVEKVYVFIRSRTWVTASFAQKFAGPDGTNLFFSEEQKRHWREHPEDYLAYRKEVESELNSRFRLYLKDSIEQREAREYSISQMTEKLAPRPEVIERLVPDFDVG